MDYESDPWTSPYWYFTITDNVKLYGLYVLGFSLPEGEYPDDYAMNSEGTTWNIATGYMDGDEGFTETGSYSITGELDGTTLFFPAENFSELELNTKYFFSWTDGENPPVSSIVEALPITSDGIKVRLSLTQPRISYNPDEMGEQLEDGTWAQERSWSPEA